MAALHLCNLFGSRLGLYVCVFIIARAIKLDMQRCAAGCIPARWLRERDQGENEEVPGDKSDGKTAGCLQGCVSS